MSLTSVIQLRYTVNLAQTADAYLGLSSDAVYVVSVQIQIWLAGSASLCCLTSWLTTHCPSLSLLSATLASLGASTWSAARYAGLLIIIHSSIHPSIHPSIHASIHSFIHSFIHSLHTFASPRVRYVQICCPSHHHHETTPRQATNLT